MTLVEELRSKKSRDNRDLLDRAADRIEELERELALTGAAPCDVGDTLYYAADGNNIIECVVTQITLEPFVDVGMVFHCNNGATFAIKDLGKTAFLSPEAAKKELAEREVKP